MCAQPQPAPEPRPSALAATRQDELAENKRELQAPAMSFVDQIFMMLRNLGVPGMTFFLDLIQPMMQGMMRVMV